VQRLLESDGASKTIEAFRLFRETFITSEDLDDAASIGVKTVRVPFMWFAFADALTRIDKKTYGEFDPDIESVIVPDPFYYQQASYVTIPRQLLTELLRNCSARGLKVVLDLHAMPSGNARGDYNGILPLHNVFWWEKARIGNTSIALKDAGLWIVEKFIRWVEGLDAQAREGVGGISLMNEPGNQLAYFLDSKDLFDWLEKAADIFRTSYLPSRGVKLYMNFIQSSINNFFELVPTWWEKTFSETERHLWAVADVHNYLAWRDDCKGHYGNITEGGYKCDEPLEEIEAKLKQCLDPFLKDLTNDFKGLRSSGEFSMSTDYQIGYACKNRKLLDMYLSVQVELFQKYGFEPFFWSWKVPYGPHFEPAWSYQKHVGLAKPPPFQCHAPIGT